MYRSVVSILLGVCVGLGLNAPVSPSKESPAPQSPTASQQQGPDSAANRSQQVGNTASQSNGDKLALTDGTPIRLKFVRQIESSKVIAGEKVALEVVEAVLVGNLVAIPGNSYAEATVTMAQARRNMGRGGNLELKVESVRLADGELVPLRAVKDVKGRGNQALVLTGVAGIAGMAFLPVAPLGFLIYAQGRRATIPAGAEITAYTAGDFAIDPSKFQVPATTTLQETTVAPPQSSTAPAEEGKPRSEEETGKRLEQLACAPSGVHFSHRTEKRTQALPEQPPDKGLIYVIRTKSWAGAAGQAKLAMDGKWAGVNRMENYFYIETDPGAHYFCMKVALEDPILLSLVIEKGRTYYVRQSFTMAGPDLELLDEGKGKEYVAKYHRSLFEEK